jgi:hypothetical protein
VAATSSGLITLDIGPGEEISTLAAGIPGVGVEVGVLLGSRVGVGVNEGVRSVDVVVGGRLPVGVRDEVGLVVGRLVFVLRMDEPAVRVAVGEAGWIWLRVGVELDVGVAVAWRPASTVMATTVGIYQVG